MDEHGLYGTRLNALQRRLDSGDSCLRCAVAVALSLPRCRCRAVAVAMVTTMLTLVKSLLEGVRQCEADASHNTALRVQTGHFYFRAHHERIQYRDFRGTTDQ